MHEAPHETHSELVDPNDAEAMLRFLGKRPLEPYFNLLLRVSSISWQPSARNTSTKS